MKKNFHFAALSQGQKAARHVRRPTTHRRFAKLDNICFPTTCLVRSSRKTKPPNKIHNKPTILLHSQQQLTLRSTVSSCLFLSFFYLNNYFLFWINVFWFFFNVKCSVSYLPALFFILLILNFPISSRVFWIQILCLKQRKEKRKPQTFNLFPACIISYFLRYAFSSIITNAFSS